MSIFYDLVSETELEDAYKIESQGKDHCKSVRHVYDQPTDIRVSGGRGRQPRNFQVS